MNQYCTNIFGSQSASLLLKIMSPMKCPLNYVISLMSPVYRLLLAMVSVIFTSFCYVMAYNNRVTVLCLKLRNSISDTCILRCLRYTMNLYSFSRFYSKAFQLIRSPLNLSEWHTRIFIHLTMFFCRFKLVRNMF